MSTENKHYAAEDEQTDLQVWNFHTLLIQKKQKIQAAHRSEEKDAGKSLLNERFKWSSYIL